MTTVDRGGRRTLVRHGESIWNRLLANEQYSIAFTSALLRAHVHEKNSAWYEHFTPEENDARELKIYIHVYVCMYICMYVFNEQAQMIDQHVPSDNKTRRSRDE